MPTPPPPLREYPPITQNSRIVLERRYFDTDPLGNFLEDIDGMFHRVSHNLSLAENNYPDSGRTPEDVAPEFFDVMRALEFIPNTPTLMNAGKLLQQLSACFVIPIDDSLEDIFDKVKHTAMIHKSGGGTGFSFSRLRMSGDSVASTRGVASGPVSFIDAFDTATDVVKQGGTRRGANMAVLRCDHPDVMSFVNAKLNPAKLQNFNISVAATDTFMQAAINDQEYDLINPRDGAVVGRQNARELFQTIIKNAHATGDPGLIFIDEINRHNPNPTLASIESVNPCGEQPLAPFESCNLGSINLSILTTTVDGKPTVDYERIARIIKTAVRLLDNVIDMNEYPLEQIRDTTRRTRRIGLGYMGWAEMLIQLSIPYDSDAAIDLARALGKFIRLETHAASAQLAAERGTYPAWESSIYAPDQPMRNSAPTTIAPTGTISIIAGASSGIEPLYGLAYERNVMDQTRLPELNSLFVQTVVDSQLGPGPIDAARAKGMIEPGDAPDWLVDLFKTSHQIGPERHVAMQAAFQENTDNAISKTINFPHDASVNEVERAYTQAYLSHCKGITVYRDGSKADQVLTTPGHHTDDEYISTLGYRKRPAQLDGVTTRIRTGHGNTYVTVNNDENGLPFEVFASAGKSGGCDAALMEAVNRLISLSLRYGIPTGDIYKQISGITCCPTWDNGIFVRSPVDAIAHVLYSETAEAQNGLNPSQPQLTPAAGQYDPFPARQSNGAGAGPSFINTGFPKAQCPDCSSPIQFVEGCSKCPTCGWGDCD